MLFRFVKHQITDWDEEGHGWYNSGDVVVGEVTKSDEQGVWLKVYSDDDMIVIVEADSFQVVEEVERWVGSIPKRCQYCRQDLPINCFFLASSKVMCHRCWLDYHHYDESSQRYELDKWDGDWVRTR